MVNIFPIQKVKDNTYLPFRDEKSVLGWMTHEPGLDTAIAALSTAWVSFTPLIIGRDCSVSEAEVWINAGGSGDEIGIALYSSDSYGAPHKLVVNFGAADASTAGIKTQVLGTPINLKAGLYWVATSAKTATSTVRGGTYPSFVGFGSNTGSQIRSGMTFRINTSIHSISFWNPLTDVSSYLLVSGELDPAPMHTPNILIR